MSLFEQSQPLSSVNRAAINYMNIPLVEMEHSGISVRRSTRWAIEMSYFVMKYYRMPFWKKVKQVVTQYLIPLLRT